MLVSGCGSAPTGANLRLAGVHDSIVRALREDDLARARVQALQLEGRLPGADTYALLGEVLWRSGEMVDAEGLFRRAKVGGAPRGGLGLARMAFARGEVDGVRQAVEPLIAVAELAADAHLVLAAVAWRAGDREVAAMQLAAASATGDIPRPWPGVEAMALQPATDTPFLDWRGATSALELDDQGRVAVTVEGRLLRLVLALDGRRTTIGGAAATALAPDVPFPAVSAKATEVALGEVRATAIVRVDPRLGDDGVLGTDLLSSLAWELSLGERRLRVAAPHGGGAADLAPADLRTTHWGTVRLVYTGLGAQLLLRPRIAGRVITAVIDVAGDSRLSVLAAGDLLDGESAPEVGARVSLELRLGAYGQTIPWRVADLLPLGAGGLIAPRAVLGVDALSGLRLRWQPDRLQLSYEEVVGAAPPAAGR